MSLRIAGHMPCEIISADSRQLYKFMDIGTAKPDKHEQLLAPHHCLDLCPPDHYFSAGEYAKIARECIRKIIKKKHMPIVVGGSGLYIQALADGIFQGNYRDPEIRKEISERASHVGWPALYQELLQIDPDAAGQIHENDHRRIVRSLEVYRLTGKPISQIQKEKTVAADFFPVFLGIRWPRAILYQRIEQRVDQMIHRGLIAEVQRLLDMGYSKTLNSLDSVGYKEIISYLEGEYSLEEAIALIKQNTRRFAKRQMTWFRRDQRIQWFSVDCDSKLSAVAEQIMPIFQNSSGMFNI